MAKNKLNETILSKRELQIVKLIWQEKTNNEIALKLKITSSGVDFHRRSIFRKTKSKTVIGILKYAIKKGLIKL